MTYDLFIADRLYSSWSMRGWLLFRAFDIPVSPKPVGLYHGTMAQDLAPVAPARLVPAVRTHDGTVIGESLAIAETLAERHPGAGIWPQDAGCRATARWLCAEMATGFSALRSSCPMQLLHVFEGFDASDAVRTDLARLDTLWAHARSVSGTTDGWLFGSRSAADIFFAPVAARIVGYDLPASASARAYCDLWLADPLFREWRRTALEQSADIDPYPLDLPTRPWPGDAG